MKSIAHLGAALFSLVLASACADDGASLGDAAAGLCSSDTQCDDGLVCSGVERCEDGACRPGTPPTCHDQDPCTRDLCLEPIGCDYVPICEDGGQPSERDARVDEDEPDASTPDARDAGSDASEPPIDASIAIPDTGIEACVGPYYVGDLVATDPSTLEQLEGVRCFIGTLTVSGNRIADLDALRALRVVTGNAYINLPRLESLRGLDGLEQIGLGLYVSRMFGTTEMDVLPALRVAGTIAIGGIVRVQRLGGLGELEQLGALRLTGMAQLRWIASSDGGPVAERIEHAEELTLQDLPKLEAVAGFGALRTITGLALRNIAAVDLSDALEQLRELSGLTLADTQLSHLPLSRLERVTTLSVSNNAALTELELGSLYSIDNLSIYGNSALGRIELPSITSLRALTLFSNALLSEVRFDQLELITDGVSLRSNAVLSACVVQALAALTPDPADRSMCCTASCLACESCVDDDAGASGGDDVEP